MRPRIVKRQSLVAGEAHAEVRVTDPHDVGMVVAWHDVVRCSMGVRETERARDLLLEADHPEASINEVCAAALEALHLVVAFDWAALMTTDHETLLPTGGFVEGFAPDTCAPFWDTELLDPDFIKFRELATSTNPIATLHHATDGDLSRSPRYLKLFEPLGVGDELRIAFLAGSECVAVATLLRSIDDGPVDDVELSDVRSLAPTVTQVLRRALGRIGQHGMGALSSPTVILLDAAGKIVGVTEGGTALLDDLRTEGVDEQGIPTLIQAAATRARWSRSENRIAHRIRGRSGQWLRLDVKPMEGDSELVAISISPARMGDLFPILLGAYGLTDRESAVTLHLVRGHSTREIAKELSISPHTVRDHVKAIYVKAGVNTRGELVAQLFSNHVLEEFHAAVGHNG